MTLVWYISGGGMLLALSLLTLRAVRGPGIYDRLQAAIALSTVAVLLLLLLGVATGQEYFLDTALVYALMGFIVVLAVLKFFEYNDMGGHDSPGSTDS